jgi:signal peptidase
MLGLSAMQPRQLAAQVLNFALVLSTAFMLWKGLSVVADSPSPIVVVLSGSMEPAFQRGDLLFLWNRGLDTQVGEIVVYNVKGKDIPIVHRVVRRYGGGWVYFPMSLLLLWKMLWPWGTQFSGFHGPTSMDTC